jgi:hypothetical protein
LLNVAEKYTKRQKAEFIDVTASITRTIIWYRNMPDDFNFLQHLCENLI